MKKLLVLLALGIMALPTSVSAGRTEGITSNSEPCVEYYGENRYTYYDDGYEVTHITGVSKWYDYSTEEYSEPTYNPEDDVIGYYTESGTCSYDCQEYIEYDYDNGGVYIDEYGNIGGWESDTVIYADGECW